MDKRQQTSTNEDLHPLAGCDAASAPPCSGYTLRGRTWIFSAERAGRADQADRAAAAGRGSLG